MNTRVKGLSAVIITRNEEGRIEKAIRSVAFAEEVLVVDSGSEDRTCELARVLGARVIHQEWLGYGRQKQYAVDQASHEWILSIDADEWVSDELADSIINLLPGPASTAYEVPRCNRFLGRWLRHGEGYPDYNLRLFHRDHARWSEDTVHEHVVCDGKVERVSGDLMHESEESLEQYLEKQNRYTSLQAERMFVQGKRFSAAKLVFSPLVRFIKMYVLRQGWRDGLPGLVHISIGCINTFVKNIKLFEKEKNAKY